MRGYDQVTGRLDYVQTGPGGSATVQNLSYSWNRLGYAGTSEQTISIGGLIEKVTRGGQTSWRHAIRAAEGTVAIYTRESGGSSAIHYLLSDHLGSVEAITDGAGAVAVRLSYAPFGQRRNAAGWSGNPSAGDWAGITATTRHGYTGHEHLDNLSLIHMNGRVYDPYIGRFTSAAPLIDGAALTAGWNRYSYVRNNPLSFTDPSGFRSVLCRGSTIPCSAFTTTVWVNPSGAQSSTATQGITVTTDQFGRQTVLANGSKYPELKHSFRLDSMSFPGMDAPRPGNGLEAGTDPGAEDGPQIQPDRIQSCSVRTGTETVIGYMGLLGDGIAAAGAYTGIVPLTAFGMGFGYAAVATSMAINMAQGDNQGFAEDLAGAAAGVIPGGRIARKLGGATLDAGRSANGRLVAGWNRRQATQDHLMQTSQSVSASAAVPEIGCAR